MDLPLTDIQWTPCYRIIPSRFPPISLFEDVADPADLDAVFQIEAMTNSRIRDQVGELSLVPKEDRISGQGSSAIMAAFTHLNPDGSRFSDGSYGVYYAGKTLETSIKESSYHRSRFLSYTLEPPQEIDMRVYTANVDAQFHDIRNLKSVPDLYHPTNYAPAQELAMQLRLSGSNGIAYSSVRDRGGECVAIFRPRLLSNCRQERHLSYVWDGHQISKIYEKRTLTH